MGYNKSFVEQLFLVCRARGISLSPARIRKELDSMKYTDDYMKIISNLRQAYKGRAKKERRKTVKETCCPPDNPLHVITEQFPEDDHSEYFASNLSHINYLVTEVRYWVASAYLRLKSIDKIISQDDSLSFLQLPAGIRTTEDLEHEIEAMAARKRKMEKTAIQQGVCLRFRELAEEYRLEDFEEKILQLLIVSETSLELKSIVEQSDIDFWDSRFRGSSMEIGAILSVLCSDYEEQLFYRRCFSVERPLVKFELVTLARVHMGFLDTDVSLHERISRFCLDDDNVYDMELLCITSERPIIQLSQVILDEQLKRDLIRYTESFLNNSKTGNNLMRSFGYGAGLTCLFYGLSGTGKTMLAHGLANYLGCQLFGVNIGGLQHEDISFEDAMKHVFREARLANGIVFLDECDDLLTDSSYMNRSFLIEIEKAKCITILATNKTVAMDPALDRRISLKIPFGLPGKQERLKIWQALLPEGMQYSQDINLDQLAAKYRFTGGLIKNTLLMAAGAAMMNAGTEYVGKVILDAEEIHKSARHQAKSMFDFCSVGRLYAPQSKLEELSLRRLDKDKLRAMAEVIPEMQQKKQGFCGLICSDNIAAAVNSVAGVAAETGLMVRRFSLYRLFSDGKNIPDAEKIVDPFTQQPVSLLEYVFLPRPGQQEIVLLVDEAYILQEFLEYEKKAKILEDWQRFQTLMREFKGVLFVASKPVDEFLVPIEFSCHLLLQYPTEEIQIQAWEKYFSDIPDDSIIELVEHYPMHVKEIDLVAKQAGVAARLERRESIGSEELIAMARRLRGKRNMPVLFGG
jgi:AAA+ superfamily predicted ATPase